VIKTITILISIVLIRDLLLDQDVLDGTYTFYTTSYLRHFKCFQKIWIIIYLKQREKWFKR